jgi:hypothetical protein
MTTLEQAQQLRQLAEKFSEGWHDGIKIDASDVMLLTEVANALEQQAEPVAVVANGVLVKSDLPQNYTGYLYAAPQQAEPVVLTLRDLLITAAATAVAAERKGRYKGAAWVADSVLEEHPQQAEPVIDDDGNSSF